MSDTGGYSLELAYVLWFMGGCGVLGLHRHYLGKHWTGVLWPFTGGLAFFGGAVPDLFRLPRMVEEANAMRAHRTAVTGGTTPNSSLPARGSAEPLERKVLRAAKAAGGMLTPATVADQSSCSLDEARKELERWVSSGDAELRATSDGAPPTVYVVPEFLSEENKSRLEP